MLSFGDLPYGAMDDTDSGAVADPFAALLLNQGVNLEYLVELSPFDASIAVESGGQAPYGGGTFGDIDFSYTGAETQEYLSAFGYTTNGSDTPSHTVYQPYLKNPFQFDVSILSGDEFRGGSVSFGALRILNGDAYFENYADYFWNGRAVNIYAGDPSFTRNQFSRIFSGVCGDIEYDEAEIIINIQDKTKVMQTEFLQSLYTGAGGLEGASNLEGKPKPLVYGEVKNVTLVPVDIGNNIYQVHDGSIEEVTAVYDRGVELNSQGDVADITAASVTGSHFKTQLSGGYIKLGGNPDGLITADVKGDNTGGYIDDAGAIISRILKTKLGSKSFSSADIDQGALNELDSTINSTVGIFIQNNTDAQKIVNELLIPLQCYWTFTRRGLFTAGVIDAPSTAIYTINENDVVDGKFSVIRVINPSWRIKAGYARSWTVQSVDNLAAAATDAYEQFTSKDYRTVLATDGVVKGRTASLSELEFNTLLINEADATSQLTRFKRIYGTKRTVYRVTVKNLLFRVYIGDTINIELNRFGLENGKSVLITGISEDAESGETELELWG